MTQEVDYSQYSDEELLSLPDTAEVVDEGVDVTAVPVSTSDVDLTDTQVETPQVTPTSTQPDATIPNTNNDVTQDGTVPPVQEGEAPSTDLVNQEIDYKAFYEQVTKPFNANGKSISMENPDDMIRLMQQGAGYHRRMQELKPMQRIGKMLESNQLLDEQSIAYLIDLNNKNPDAIAKLVKDSGLDVYSLNTEDSNYIPTAHGVDESTLQLQDVLDDMKVSSPTYNRTISIVGNEWDTHSREVLAANPGLIRIIDQQVSDGTYDKISTAVERERMLGRLSGVTDIDAYEQVGRQLAGVSAPQTQATAQQPSVQPVQSVAQQIPGLPANHQQIVDDRKRAASAPRATTASAPTANANTNQFNTMAYSDEEILKMAN